MYDRRVGEQTLSFGVSGRLYHSNLLLYDRQTESLWSQITAEAVAGRLTGTKLDTVPFMLTTWKAWQQCHPHSLVLAERRVPAFFSALGQVFHILIAPVHVERRQTSSGTHPSLTDMVLGVTVGDDKKAYPLDTLARRAVPFFPDLIGDTAVRIFFVPPSGFAYAETSEGKRLPSVVTYRATWFAFFPHSQLYSAGD